MLQPFLFVGLGGSGGKTLRAIKAELTDKIELAGWDVRTQGFPAMWQFLHIDTPYIQDGGSFNARLLDPSEYLGLVNAGVSVDNILDSIESKGFPPLLLEEVLTQLPRKGARRSDVTDSRPISRQEARAAAISKLGEVRERVKLSLRKIKDSAAESHAIAEKLGEFPDDQTSPNIVIVSSLTGSAGSGALLDVCEAIKAADPSSRYVSNQTAVVYTPDVFEDPKIRERRQASPNALEAVSELVNGQWRTKRYEVSGELYKKFAFAESISNGNNVGPSNVYLFGRSNGKVTFTNQNDVYFAAASILAKWAIDPSIWFNYSLYHYDPTAGSVDSAGLMVDYRDSAPMTSLGFARVSLGIDSFAKFAAQRIARSAISKLLEGHLEGQQSGESEQAAVQRTAAKLFQYYFTDLNVMPHENVVEPHFEVTPTDSIPTYEQWVIEVQGRIVDVSVRYASKYGLLVAIEMLRKLKERLANFVSTAESETIDAISFQKKLVKDMKVQLLDPLVEELEIMYGNLLYSSKNSDYSQTGENVFESWPDGESIPSMFVPAPNVRLLQPHTSFNAKFNELLDYSVKGEGSEKDALSRAVEEFVNGSDQIADLRVEFSHQQDHKVPSRAIWSMLEIESRWWPAALAGQPQSRWRGKFVFKLEDWEDNAKKYVRMETRPMGKFIHTTLSQWLRPDSETLRIQRENQLLSEFDSIIRLAKPFSELNPVLHSEAHGGPIPDADFFLGKLPPEIDHDLQSRLEELLAKSDIHNQRLSSSSHFGASHSSIDIFSTLSRPVHHFVFDNLMKSINDGWKKVESHASDRLAFMRMRKTRTLPETVPLAPEILDGLLRGWYVAKLLGRVKEESGETGQGPRLSVFREHEINSGWDGLPYPLYHHQTVVPYEDYPAVVVASVALALSHCSEAASMKPFTAYRSLLLLGGPLTYENVIRGNELQLGETLSKWILEGKSNAALAPIPDPKRAGDITMSRQERKESVISFFYRELQWFEDNIVNLPSGKRHDTLVWELRREVKAALQELIRMVSTLQEG